MAPYTDYISQSKMVNVNAQLPFNLHNQKLDQRLDPSSSRSARSHSGGAHVNYSNQNSRRPSPSPAPSIQLSRSSASLPHPGDVASSKISLDIEPRKPPLNVRLVRSIEKRRASSSRARGRLGRFGEESGRVVCIDNGDGSSQVEETAQENYPIESQDDAEELLTPRPPDLATQWATSQEPSTVSAHADFSFIYIFSSLVSFSGPFS